MTQPSNKSVGHSASDIILALADCDVPRVSENTYSHWRPDPDFFCLLCGSAKCEPSCPHRMAQEWVAEHPPTEPDPVLTRAEAAERGLEELGREVGRALVAATLGEQECLADRKDPEHAIVACVLGLKDQISEAERELTSCRAELAQSTAAMICLSQQLDRMRALVAEFEAQEDHEADDPGKLLSKLIRELKVPPAKDKHPARYHTDGCPAVHGTSQSTTTCAVWCKARKAT